MRAGATKIDTLETGIVARKAQPFFNYESGEHSFFKPRTAFIQPKLTIVKVNIAAMRKSMSLNTLTHLSRLCTRMHAHL